MSKQLQAKQNALAPFANLPPVVKVLIKDEGEENGQLIGPVYLQFADGEMQPFDPQGNWHTGSEAKRLAAMVGVPLEVC